MDTWTIHFNVNTVLSSASMSTTTLLDTEEKMTVEKVVMELRTILGAELYTRVNRIFTLTNDNDETQTIWFSDLPRK